MVAVAGIAFLLISPLGAVTVGVALHALTGKWAMASYAGNMLGLTACALAIAVAVRCLEPDDESFASKFARNVQLPIRVAVPILFAIFWESNATRVRNLNSFQVQPDGWLGLYWTLLGALYIYLLGYAARAFLTLRHDRDSRPVAIIYFWASVAGIVACICRIALSTVTRGLPGHPMLQVFSYTCVAMFAIGAAVSWRRKASRPPALDPE